MTKFNLPEHLRQYYIDVLTKNPLFWAGDSIDLIASIVKAGSHEPHGDLDDPDGVVKRNRDYLVGAIELFVGLGLPVPGEIQPSIDLADDFLKDAT